LFVYHLSFSHHALPLSLYIYNRNGSKLFLFLSLPHARFSPSRHTRSNTSLEGKNQLPRPIINLVRQTKWLHVQENSDQTVQYREISTRI
jgi:hypothetical protein